MSDLEAQTPYEMQRPPSIKDAETSVRSAFVRKVYGILTAQLVLTIIVAAPFQQMDNKLLNTYSWVFLGALVMTFVTICAMACPGVSAVCRKYPGNYISLFTFTFFEGIVVGFISAQYTWQSVLLAMGMTAGITGSMSVYAYFTKTDFTGLSAYLFTGLMTMCGCGFVLTIMGFSGVHMHALFVMYDIFGVLIFTIYIVHDTQKILGGDHKETFGVDDYVFAALNLYLDIINLFLYLLQLFGEKK